MALGYANTTYPSQFPSIVSDVLNYDGMLKDLLPQSALLLATAVPELARVSVDLVVQIADRMLLAYEGAIAPVPRIMRPLRLFASV
jgi:hypothetical protein